MITEIVADLDDQLASVCINDKPSQLDALPRYFYDGIAYYYQADSGIFFPMTETNLIRRLKQDGCEVETDDKPTCVPYVLRIQQEHAVSWCGPVAGFKAGVCKLPTGEDILVTHTTSPIAPKPGEWKTIRKIISEMFDEGADFQSPHFHSHQKTFLESYTVQMSADRPVLNLHPGPCCVLAGPKNAGKSLLVSSIVSPMFGNKIAKPYQAMSGKSNFNGDTVGAPILLIDDEGGGADRKQRTILGSGIKEYCFAPGRNIHGKHKQPIILYPCQRVYICVNDDPDHITVLPPLDDHMRDKMLLFRVSPANLEEFSGLAGRQELQRRIQSELPAYVHFLMNEFEIPSEIRGGRTGFKTFIHPELDNLLEELDPDTRILDLIDNLFEAEAMCDVMDRRGRRDPLAPWNGTAADFERKMRDKLDSWEGSRYFRSNIAAGILLRRLANRYPSRVEASSTVNGTKRWTIFPPVGASARK